VRRNDDEEASGDPSGCKGNCFKWNITAFLAVRKHNLAGEVDSVSVFRHVNNSDRIKHGNF
jgi:hypothetical protein